MNEPRYHEHDAESENWYYCAIDTPGHWYPGNSKRPVNWCYEHRWPGTRRNPADADDCACEAIEEQAYERAAHYKSETY